MMTLKTLSGLAGLALLGIAGCRKHSDSPPPPVPPVASAPAQLEAGDLAPLAEGTVTGEGDLAFQATVSASPEHLWVRLHVEVVLFGAPFTGQPTATSDSAPNGDVATAVVLDLQPGGYVWRCWAVDPAGLSSPFVEFNGPAGPDFVVDPLVPTRLGQFGIDGATALAVGAETPEAAVVLKARVHSPQSALVRAQVEVKPVGVAFDWTGLESGSWVPAGKASDATVKVPPGDFHWRARTEPRGGSPGPWVEFGANGGAADFLRGPAPATNLPPDLPFSMGQFKTDLVTAIGLGGSTPEGMIVLGSWVNDPEGGHTSLEVEVKPIASVFDGTGIVSGPFAPNYTQTFAAVPLGPGSYHWRARVSDGFGAVSSWAAYGYNSDAVPAVADFIAVYGANSPPGVPTNLRQYRLDGATAIPYGESTPETGLVVKANVSDPDPGSGIFLEVEIRPVGTPFLNVPMALSSPMSSGSLAAVRIDALRPGTTYHWQARTVDPQGGASGWVEFKGIPPPASPPSSGGGYSGGSGSVTTGACGATGLELLFLLGLAGLKRRSPSHGGRTSGDAL